jgi:hypothetical protein
LGENLAIDRLRLRELPSELVLPRQLDRLL